MAHDPLLERRLADALAGQGVKAEPKRMFGGVAFMVRGNMCVGVTNKSLLMVRFAPGRHEEILGWPGAMPMTHGKGHMKGFLFVDPDTASDRRSLDRWVKLAVDHLAGLPTKAMKTSSSRAGRKTVAKKAASPKKPARSAASSRSKRKA